MIEIDHQLAILVSATNSLYASWDDTLYPDGVGAWAAPSTPTATAPMAIDQRFFPHGDDFQGLPPCTRPPSGWRCLQRLLLLRRLAAEMS